MTAKDLFDLLCEARDFVQEGADVGYRRTEAERLLRRMEFAGVPVPPEPEYEPEPERPAPPPPPLPRGGAPVSDEDLWMWIAA